VDDIAAIAVITIITIIRRRDGTQPKNHCQPSWLPVAFALLLWFFHLLLRLPRFSYPFCSAIASCLVPVCPLDSSVFRLLLGQRRRHVDALHDVFSRSPPATLIGELSREIMHCSELTRSFARSLARSLSLSLARTVRMHAHDH
jgi:hypothetical protein